ncbi:MAG: VWA domain-containing protein [Planctomycetaceae bacterium]|nr:VWA domain-containing protein [Planctomycetaceae bacterium]
MIQLQYPEFLLLAIPLVYGFARWGGFCPSWVWAAPVAGWIALQALWIGLLPWWSHVWLVVPVVMFLWPWLRTARVTGAIRLLLICLLLFALTGPRWNRGGDGIDVVVIADRSLSMPGDSHGSVLELINNLESNRGPGDRVGVVTFGSDAQIEHELSQDALLESFTREVLPDGSDLDDAILTSLNLIDPNRPARILVLSDGESNGASPLSGARRARELGVPIDFRTYERLRAGDAAVRSISLPETVSPREPFQFSVSLFADKDVDGTLRVLRNGNPVATQDGPFLTGTNRLAFRDLIEEGGMHNYTVELEVPDDPLRENNVGAGLVRVDAGPRILVLNSDGAEGNIVRALRSARLPVDLAVAGTHPLTQDALDPYRAVIIENVPAKEFGRVKMERLAQFVEDLGGGLLLTGGQRSFGAGGYFNSPLDDVLPVSMEIREEHRKTRVAIAIALDRSGSMSAPVAGGKTKMDLANLGTAECVRLLSAGDSVAVIAVDSTPHTIQQLTPVEDPEAIARKALTIESMGGGIFVYEALVAAGQQLMKAEQATKHIILFSDAADSEEPGSYKSLLSKYETAGITVSVIGLGTMADVDAKLLQDIATRGSGNIMFTTDPSELPRLFTEDTMSVARSSFIEKDPETQPNGIDGTPLADAQLLGNLPLGAFPTVDGYNLSYLKPDATAAVISADEYAAPWAAFWYRGLGRVAAVTLEVDGQYSGRFGRWDSYDDFLITHARWLLGGDDPDDVFVDIDRQGQDAVITVELDPIRPEKGSGEMPELVVVPPADDRAAPIAPDFTWVGPDTLEGRFRMDRTGNWRTLVKTRGREIKRGPAVSLPYSPEFDPREGLPTGSEILAEVAELSGGVERPDVLDVLQNPPRSARTSSLLPWLFILGITLLVLEIAGRRLSLWERFTDAATAGIPEVMKPRGWLPQWKLSLPKREKRPAESPSTESATASAKEVVHPSTGPPSRSSTPQKAAEKKPATDVFAAAKQKAKRRLK